VVQRSGLTRGDRRRNDRIAALRMVVTSDRAILSIDLGEDKQVAVLLDHDGRVLGRRTVTAKAYALGGLLAWASGQAVRHGFVGVVVGCEPTGHRWRAVMGLADDAGLGFVCVQSLRVHLAREADDYTRDKTDHKDAVLIGKLISRLDCYLPERAQADWARLRHLGQRRARLVTEVTACGQQIVDLLSCCWPAALGCAVKPLETTSWWACLAAALDAGDPAQAARGGRDAFIAAARAQLSRFDAQRLSHKVAGRFFIALSDAAGVSAQRRGGLERVGFLLDDWRHATARLSDVEQRMVGVLDAMELTTLVTSIPGLSAVGAAVILAETGDLSRFASARSVVKHAGLNPAENTSATFRGATHVSRRGRPTLRVAAWRAVWGALPNNPILAAKYTHLTRRDRDQLTPGQARVACAATLLRWLHAIVTRRQPFNSNIASGATRQLATAAAAWPITTPAFAAQPRRPPSPAGRARLPVEPPSSCLTKGRPAAPAQARLHAVGSPSPRGQGQTRLMIYVEPRDPRRSPHHTRRRSPKRRSRPAQRRPAMPTCPQPTPPRSSTSRPPTARNPPPPRTLINNLPQARDLTTASYVGEATSNPRTSRPPSPLTPTATKACTLTVRPASRTLMVNASSHTNVYGPPSRGRLRNASTWASR
jgi:transposase